MIAAHRRGVAVALLVDKGAAKSNSGRAALNLVIKAGIDAKTVGPYAILHDKYMVADRRHVQTGSFN